MPYKIAYALTALLLGLWMMVIFYRDQAILALLLKDSGHEFGAVFVAADGSYVQFVSENAPSDHTARPEGMAPAPLQKKVPNPNSLKALVISYYLHSQWNRWLENKFWLDANRNLQCPADGSALPSQTICYDFALDSIKIEMRSK